MSKKNDAGGAKRATMRVRPSAVEAGHGSQQFAPGFEAASTAACKRKAEDRVNDKLTAMAATTSQLVMAQKQTAESQKAFLESNKANVIRGEANQVG